MPQSNPAADTSQRLVTPPGRRFLRNITWNLLGVAIPLVAAAFAAPLLLKELGNARFGMLTLAWTLIGYFSIFDLGLGRAVTKSVSQRLGQGDTRNISVVVWTGAISTLGMGTLVALLVWGFAAPLIGLMSKLPPELHDEAVEALRMLAIALPVVIASPIFSGALEAYQRFDIVNMLRTPAGLVNFLAPLAVIPFSSNLSYLVIVLGLCKLAVTMGYIVGCLRVVHGFRQPLWRLHELIDLLRFGGWIMLGNVLNPIVAYTDRFLITAYVSIAVVGHYVLPYEVLMRVLVPVIAITAVLFPAFSGGLAQDHDRVRNVFSLCLKIVMFGAFPLTFIIAALSQDLLRWWLNPEAAQAAYFVTKLFAVGIFLTSLNQITLTLIQAKGHPDWIPKLFLIELPFYIPILIWSTKHFGINGAATAWLARIFVDFIFLFWGTKRSVPFVKETADRFLPCLLALLVSFSLTLIPAALYARALLIVVCLSAFFAFGWFRLLDAGEKDLILRTARLKTA